MHDTETTPQILVIDSNHDDVTEITHNYRNQYVYPDLESKGFGLVRCQGRSACRETVASEACRDDIAYIAGAGHGNYTTYIGKDNLPIFHVGDYQPEEVEGKVVHLLSCQTAAELGPDFVTNGCRAYFGYKGNFTFDPGDPDIFLECDAEIDRAFADGLTAEEVHDRVIALYNQRIAELESEGRDYTASILERDRDYLCTPSVDSRWGDVQVRIFQSNT